MVMELLSRERSRERSGSAIMEDFELIKTLDSGRQSEVSEITTIMKDMLATCKEPWLLNTLVDYYFQTGSSGALDVLKSIKQIQAQVIMTLVAASFVRATGGRYNIIDKFCGVRLVIIIRLIVPGVISLANLIGLVSVEREPKITKDESNQTEVQ